MTENEGWTWLMNSKKWHYFVDGESLCKRWMYLGSSLDKLQKGNNDSPDNCVVCKKKLLARDAQLRNEAVQPQHSGLGIKKNISKCLMCGSARNVVDGYLDACPQCGDVRRKITIGKTIVI